MSNKYNDLLKDLSEVQDVLASNKDINSYFIYIGLKDTKSYNKYTSNNYLMMIGVIELLIMDIKLQLLESIEEKPLSNKKGKGSMLN